MTDDYAYKNLIHFDFERIMLITYYKKGDETGEVDKLMCDLLKTKILYL